MLLPVGQRRQALEEGFNQLMEEDLGSRVLIFDSAASTQAAIIAAQRRDRGQPVDMRDTFIAGIAIARRATLATRNLRHFSDLPTPVINPWD